MRRTLYSVEEVSRFIRDGRRLVVAGLPTLLDQLPAGAWIGGTTPYLMGEAGGVTGSDKLAVSEVPASVEAQVIKTYGAAQLPDLVRDEFEHGFSVILLPVGTDVQLTFAQTAPSFPGLYERPLVGWVAGAPVGQTEQKAKVYDGSTGTVHEDRAVVLHARLPPTQAAEIDIVNPFEPGDGDALSFEHTGFTATHCLVDGKRVPLLQYIQEKGVKPYQPLVADYYGSRINTSLWEVNAETGTVRFASPVFEGKQYRFSKPLEDYAGSLMRAVPAGLDPTIVCNCVGNYLLAGLEGRSIPSTEGPMVFGEVGYILMNQTIVYLVIRDL